MSTSFSDYNKMFVLNDLHFDCLWSSQIFLANNLASGLGFILSLAVSASIVNSVRRFCSSNVFPGARHLPFHLVLLFTHIIFELLLLRMHVSLTCHTTWHNRGRVPGAPRILFPFRLPSLSFTGRLLSRMLRDEAWRQTPLRKCSFILLEAAWLRRHVLCSDLTGPASHRIRNAVAFPSKLQREVWGQGSCWSPEAHGHGRGEEDLPKARCWGLSSHLAPCVKCPIVRWGSGGSPKPKTVTPQ